MAYPKYKSESVAFRENFDTVASVIDNGGTPSNGAVIDKSFTGTGNGEVITYANNPLFSNFFSKERSVEVEFTASSVGESIGLIMGKEGGNTGWTIFLSDDTGSAAKLNFFQYFTTTDGKWRTVSAVITYGTRYTLGVTYDSSSTANNPVITLDGVVVSITEVFTPAGTADDDTAQAFKVGNTLATGQSFDGSVYGVSLYFSAKTTEEFLDITEQDTFEEIDDSKALVSLPLRTQYDSGGSIVTDNIGSLGGTALCGNGAAGIPDQLNPKGFDLNGTTQYVDLTSLVGTALNAATKVSVCMMVKANSISITGNDGFMSSDGISALFHFQTTPTGIQAYIYTTGTPISSVSTVAVPVGSWMHVAFCYDSAAGTAKVYQDGILTQTGTGGTGVLSNIGAKNLYIGNGFAGTRFFDGTIVSPRLFLSCLTATQIKELANRDLRMINN